MSYKRWYPILMEELKKAYAKVPELSESHNIDHILRVWKTAEGLGIRLDADMEVLVAAVLLHDLGRHYPGGEGIHGPQGAELAKPVLESINFPKEKISKVLEAISLHDLQTDKSERKSVESQIMFDADKIDAFGAKAIARIFLFFPKKGKDLKWIIDAHTGKDNRITRRYESLHFPESKKIVEKNYYYMIDFFEKLKQELT